MSEIAVPMTEGANEVRDDIVRCASRFFWANEYAATRVDWLMRYAYYEGLKAGRKESAS